MAEPWEDLPDVAEQSTADSWESLPDVTPAAPAPAPWLSSTDISQMAGTQPQFADEAQLVSNVFEAGLSSSEGDTADALRIAKQLGIPTDRVRAALPEFRKTAEAAGFDSQKWMAENPMLYGVLFRNPEAGELVTRNKKLSVVTQAFMAASDVAPTLFGGGLEMAEEIGNQLSTVLGGDDAVRARAEEIAKRQAEREAGRPTQELDDAVAQEARGNPLAVANLRRQETLAQTEVSRIGTRLMLATRTGEDTTELESQLYDAQLRARPRALDEGAAMQVLTDAVTGVTSSVAMLAGGAEGTVKGAAGGAVIGALATRTPAGARQGAMLGVKYGSILGAGAETLDVETGSSWLELRDVRMDNGEKLPADVALGAALFSGAAKTVVELAEFELQKQAFEPLAAAAKAGNRQPLIAALKSSPALRAKMAELAKTWGPGVKAGVGEAFEEGAQTGIEQISQFMAETVAGDMPERSPVNMEAVRESMGAALPAGFVFGGAGPALSMLESAVTLRRSEKAQAQVPLLMQMATEPAFAAAPTEFAEVIESTTTQTGEPVTSLHVDASAVVRYFQEQGQDGAAANRAVAELLGDEAPSRLLEAAASGGKLEIPLESLPAWSASELGRNTVADTTTDSGLLSGTQLKEQQADIEAEASRIAAAELVVYEEQQLVQQRRRDLEQQLIASGQRKDVARLGAALVGAFVETQAADFDQAVSQVFPEAPLSFAAGDEQASTEGRLNQDAVDLLAQRATEVDTDTRATELFMDPVSGLRTRRAWDASPRRPGDQVAVITSPDIKAINDDPKGGHDTANELLRLIGGVVAGIDPEAARSGTNFLVHVQSQAQLNAALEQIRGALPQGLDVAGSAAADIDTAFKQLDESQNRMRASGRLAERGKTSFDLSTLPSRPFAQAQGATPNVSPELRAQAESLSPEQFGATAYMDKEVPGVLSKVGFDASPSKAHVAAFDLRGLKNINDRLGKGVGDAIIKAFGEAAARIGGRGVSFAHLSGDEYAAKHDNRAELEDFVDALDTELRQVVIRASVDGGPVEEHSPRFRFGIGEKTYGAADQNLNARKRAEAAGEPAPSRRAGEEGRRGVGDGTRSAGLAEAGVTRLAQDAFQEDGATPKGYAELPAGRALQKTIRVFLNKSADASTVIHESAHAFLEQLADLVERPDAPQRTKDTYAAALKALGVESREEVKTEQHEKFARWFEKYVMEGSAPQAGLRAAFAKFSRWLVGIYRTIRGIPGVELNDDIRLVFDAMLATEQQVAAMRRRQGPVLDAGQVGVTPEDRRAQEQQSADEYTEGSHQAQARVIKDALRVREAWWKKGLKQLEKAFGEEYDRLPAVRAQSLIVEEELVLDRDAVRAVIGDLRVPGMRTREGGLNPARVAEVSGYGSATEMLANMAAVLPGGREAWVRKNADAEMRRLHPAIIDDIGRLRALLAGGLHEATVKRLEREVRGLNRAATKRAAEMLVQRREVRDVKPGRALALQRAAAQRKARAMAKGDIAATRLAAEQELLNAYLHRDLIQAAEDIEKLETQAQRMRKSSTRERLGKAAPAYLEASDFLLGSFGMGPPSELGAETLTAVVAQMNGDSVEIGDPEWLAPVSQALSRVETYERLTVAEVGALRDALTMIETAARNRTSLIVDGKRVEREAFIEGLLSESAENKRPAAPVNSPNFIDALFSKAAAFTAPLLKIETMFDWLGGSLIGKDPLKSNWHQLFMMLESARQHETAVQRDYSKTVIDAWRNMPKEVQNSFGDGVDGEALFPNHGVMLGDGVRARQSLAPPSTVGELFMMLLNAGNTGNLDRMLRGRNITIQELRTAFDTHMTPAHIDAANAIGQAFESMWPQIQAMEERITGIRPMGVEKQPLQLRNGTVNGHYFPAIYEAQVSGPGRAQEEEQVDALFHPAVGRPQTLAGHRKSRADEVVGVIALNPNVIPTHLAQHAHDLAFYERVRDVWQVVSDRRVQDALFSALGPERGAQARQWVKDAAKVTGIDGAVTGGWALKTLQKLKANLTVSALGYSVANLREDLSGLVATAFDRDFTFTHWAKGLLSFYAPGSGGFGALAEKSRYLAASEDSLQRELVGIVKDIQRPSGALGKAKRAEEFVQAHAFDLVEVAFRMTAGPAWLGRYQQGIAEGRTEDDAIQAADALVRRMFPSHSPVNAAGVSRNKFLAPFVPFYSFFSTVVNKRLDEWQRVLEAPDYLEKAKAAGRAAGYALSVSLLAAALKGRGPREGDPPEEWALLTLMNSELAMVPFGSDLGNALESAVLGRRGTARPSLVGALVGGSVEAVTAMQQEDPASWATFRATLRVLGLSRGLPATQVIRTGNALDKLGEQADVGALDAANQLMVGPPRQ